MAQECELLAACGFFKKYQAAKSLVCKGFITRFCKGAQMNQCKRKEYRAQHGSPPPDDMMPSGHTLDE